jgi:hypothetical protein
MATTKIADIIEPEVFAAYVREMIIEKSAIIRSGITTQDTRLNSLVTGGGRTINMPFWRRIGGDSEVLSDINPLTPDKIGTAKDVATMHKRGRAWGANELASAIAGDSAIDAIASMASEWWTREEQKILIATLTGMFASPTMATHVYGDGSVVLDANMTLDAKQLLGDASDQLAAVFMHSKTYTHLQKLNLIDFIPDARGEIVLTSYLGYRVIIDDTMPVTGSGASAVYTTYLMANGVVGRGDGTPVDFTTVETDRDSLLGEDYLIYRRAFVLHPMGVSWIGTAAGTTPTNAELMMGANWQKVYDDKHLGMVQIKHLVGAV